MVFAWHHEQKSQDLLHALQNYSQTVLELVPLMYCALAGSSLDNHVQARGLPLLYG